MGVFLQNSSQQAPAEVKVSHEHTVVVHHRALNEDDVAAQVGWEGSSWKLWVRFCTTEEGPIGTEMSCQF